MPDVPEQVNYGFITGRFVQFVADTGDPGTVPDEIPLTGTATLRPTVTLMRFPTTTPPRTAYITTVIARIVDGNLLAPDGSATLAVIASDQPAGDPNFVQWQVDIRLDGVTTQPAPVTINVPTSGTVDLTTVIPSPPEPPAIVVVSTVDRELAQQAAVDAANFSSDAEAAALRAADAAGEAEQTLQDMPSWWFGTQAEYDAIVAKDPDTLYAITG
jgi:hypothetical protein